MATIYLMTLYLYLRFTIKSYDLFERYIVDAAIKSSSIGTFYSN